MLASLLLEYRRMPVLMRAGVLVFALGGLIDLLLHSVGFLLGAAAPGWFESLEMVFHVVILLGMVIIMVGIMAAQRGFAAQRRAAAKGGVDT